MPAALQTRTLPNGVQLICQPRPHAPSVTLGVWLHHGTRCEAAQERGYTHLLEHLLFKRTRHRSPLAIARCCDRLGGRINAHTGRELMALYGSVPTKYAAELAELLLDLLLNPAFQEDDIESERAIILAEQAAVAAPQDDVRAQVWAGHPLGLPVIGELTVMQTATAARLHAYHQTLLGQPLALIAVGPLDLTQLPVLPLTRLTPLPETRAVQSPPLFTPSGVTAGRIMPAPALTAPDYSAALVANQLLGGGLSSRLLRRLREERGLVYDIRSQLDSYSDAGLWFIHADCRPAHARQVQDEIDTVLRELADNGPDGEELLTAREALLTAALLADDEPETVMERLAREHFFLGRQPTLAERLEPLEAVDGVAVQRVLHNALQAG